MLKDRPKTHHTINILLAIAITLNTFFPALMTGATPSIAPPAPLVHTQQTATTALTVQAPDTPLGLNQTFAVTVHIDSLTTALRAFQFDVVYDSAAVALTDVTTNELDITNTLDPSPYLGVAASWRSDLACSS